MQASADVSAICNPKRLCTVRPTSPILATSFNKIVNIGP